MLRKGPTLRNPLFVVCITVLAMLSVVRAQTDWTVPRLADGRPDLQGVWENNSATPLERPRELANTPRLTKSELDALRRSTLSTSRCSTRTGPPGARS